MKVIKWFFYSVLICSTLSCVDHKEKREETKLDVQVKNSQKLEKIKEVFYNLPAPLELTRMFSKEGIRYNKELLHKTDVVDEYHTSIKKALNLGVYGADLSFSGLFGKNLGTIEYFTICQKLAADLSISNAFETKYISRLERNAGNKDTLIQVIADFFEMNDEEMYGDNHQDISTYILIGGWIEGVYLGTSMVNVSTDIQGIKDLVLNQNEALSSLSYLIKHVHRNPQSDKLAKEINKLMVLYRNYSESESSKDEVFQKIVSKVGEIREGIISY